jgi:hypothetical protein
MRRRRPSDFRYQFTAIGTTTLTPGVRRWFWVRIPANPFSEKGRLSLVAQTKATPLESWDEQERNEKPENQ